LPYSRIRFTFRNLDSECIDDQTYISPANSNFGCEIYDGNCLTLWVSFLTPEQIDEALKRCPMSCGVPCTFAPSRSPSFYPSYLPSEQRTISSMPSDIPSISDLTLSPSRENSPHPSEYPTYGPTTTHSMIPSPLQTSWKPSVSPSVSATSYPSITASRQPSLEPTMSPTVKSTGEPSLSVSDSPTIMASGHPTVQHSVHPSIIPTKVPSIDPTANPSSIPSIHKSESPSSNPTALPSVQHSVHPSIVPTLASSKAPSIDPTENPSSTPSVRKSESPSNLPTGEPSINPSIGISSSPSTSISPTITSTTEFPSLMPYSLSSNPTHSHSLTVSSKPSICVDDNEYRSPINPRFGCELYCGTDCLQWGSLLNFTQLQEVFTRCPDSCKVPCGYTLPPSYMSLPSSAPSISNIPTQQPSPQLSFVPSNGVTSASPSYRSESPSSRPSKANPSSFPSTQAVTSTPSLNKSIMPTFVLSDSPSLLPTTHPSTYPSISPTRCGIPEDVRIMEIFEILRNVTDLRLLLNPDSSQGKAMNWLLYEDAAHLCPNEVYDCKNRIVQRYTLAVIYFATGGDFWSRCSRFDLNCGNETPFINATNFLGDGHECNWAGIKCRVESNCVTVIDFENNNMEGTIPSEISSLIYLEIWAMEQGRLRSTIPSTISSLANLLLLDLDFNLLTGTLPSELFTLTNLRQLDLNNNTLSGPIDGIENLVNLQFLQLHQNRFTGTIPTAMDQLLDLNTFTSYDTKLGGAPDSLCKNTAINGGQLKVLTTECPCTCCTNSCPAG